MNEITYYETKAAAVSLGIDAYQEAYHPYLPDELQALGDLFHDAEDWRKTAEAMRKERPPMTVLECLQAHLPSSIIRRAVVIVRNPEDDVPSKFDGTIESMLQLLAPNLLRTNVSFYVEDEEQSVVRIIAELRKEEVSL